MSCATDGLVIARFDLAYPERRIAIEYDSYRHHFGRQAWARDHIRHNAVTAEGWLILYVTTIDPQAITAVVRAYARRAPMPH